METEISKNEDRNSPSLTVRQKLKLFGNKGSALGEESMSLTKMGRGMCRQIPLVQDRHFGGEGEEPGNCIEEQKEVSPTPRLVVMGEQHKPLSERAVREVGSWGDSGFSSQWEGGAPRTWGVFQSILGSVAQNASSNTYSLSVLSDLNQAISGLHASIHL